MRASLRRSRFCFIRNFSFVHSSTISGADGELGQYFRVSDRFDAARWCRERRLLFLTR